MYISQSLNHTWSINNKKIYKKTLFKKKYSGHSLERYLAMETFINMFNVVFFFFSLEHRIALEKNWVMYP
jgi:hypothetical protein